jgi:hypothetical protein
MHFMFRKGSLCQFLEEDLKTPLPRNVMFEDDKKIWEMAKQLQLNLGGGEKEFGECIGVTGFARSRGNIRRNGSGVEGIEQNCRNRANECQVSKKHLLHERSSPLFIQVGHQDPVCIIL